MALKPIAVSLLVGIGLFVISQRACVAAAKKEPGKADPAARSVEKVLRAEAVGQVDRRALLAEALQARSDSPLARWQAGFVRDGKSWRSFDETDSTAADADIRRQYLARRGETAKTFEDQLELADWCGQRRLADQEQAHLAAALTLAPESDRPPLLERLGYVQFGTQWLSPEQLAEWQRANREAEASLKKWSSKLERIASSMNGTKRRHEAALAALRPMADPSAVPAIEFILEGRDEECALAAVEALAPIEGPAATRALAEHGVFSIWPEVRRSAAGALKGRKLDDFVPPLISLLATPAEGEFRILRDGMRGTTYYSYVMATETESRFQVAKLTIVNQGVDPQLGGAPHLAVLPNDPVLSGLPILFGFDQVKRATNERIEELNGRIIAVLAEVTGKRPTPDARTWWKWWSEESDSQRSERKPAVVVRDETASTFTAEVPLTQAPAECFASGTPVWTDNGLMPVEKIKVGDRVLSKDVETGELAYKPVLHTTVRPPRELVTLRLGDETIVCTGGHRFWNSGDGWTKARDLAPQTLLSTVTGNTPVWPAKVGPTAETYNLVVAGFHTYFVGKRGVLCQDLLIPRGTNNVVPGLARK
jgi:hypothetical protein